jgi:hypothetical protein
MRHTYDDSAVLSTFEHPMSAPRADREMSRFMNDLSGAIKRAPTPYFRNFLGAMWVESSYDHSLAKWGSLFAIAPNSSAFFPQWIRANFPSKRWMFAQVSPNHASQNVGDVKVFLTTSLRICPSLSAE